MTNTEERWQAEHGRFHADQRPVVAWVLHPLEAMSDWRFSASASELVAMAMESAITGGDLECFGCAEPWTPERIFAAVLVLEHLPERPDSDMSSGYMAGLCRACCDDRIIRAACRREFECEPLHLGKAGHA